MREAPVLQARCQHLPCLQGDTGCPHALPTAGPECSESSQGVTSWCRRLI